MLRRQPWTDLKPVRRTARERGESCAKFITRTHEVVTLHHLWRIPFAHCAYGTGYHSRAVAPSDSRLRVVSRAARRRSMIGVGECVPIIPCTVARSTTVLYHSISDTLLLLTLLYSLLLLYICICDLYHIHYPY